MIHQLLDNSFFRNIYCYLAGGSESCAERGYAPGFFSPSLDWLAFLITGVVVAFVILNLFLAGLLIMIWVERRLVGRFQNRSGPNRWGPFGLLTPVADAVKIMVKEDIVPKDADRFLYTVAPVLVMAPILAVWAVIPVGLNIFSANINAALLFVLGITAVSVFAIIIAGWSSGNRIAIFSSIRAVALVISYEIPAALALVGVVLITGSLSLVDIVMAQDVPFLIVQPLGFAVFVIASLAETNRTPFDLTEAESELAAGHLNDYSSMKFGLLFVTEYAATITAAALITTLFLGGWRGWGFLPSPVWFILKTFIVLVGIIWMRVSWPRLRIDQMLDIAWKGLFELTLINIVATAVMVYFFPSPSASQLWIIAAVNWAIFFPSVWMIGKLVKKSSPPVLPEPGTVFSTYPVAPAESEGSS